LPAVPAPPPALLATIRRGTALEAVIRGHAVVVDAAGTVLAAAGDPAAVTTLRSCVKPIQAMPLVRDAAASLGLPDDEIAIACASHSGEPVHVDVVRRLLGRVGLTEAALSCGPQPPMDEAAAEALLAAGGTPTPVTNNCSGKHAGMLAVCAVRGWPTSGYADAAHPLQVEIRVIMGELGAVDLARAPVGIDGCGLPTYGLPLRVLARMFVAASADAAFGRCQAAMAAHPYLVAGRQRFDTALLEVAGAGITAKGGAAGVWVAVRRPAGPALAIKLEAGDQSAVSAVALAALDRLGWLGAGQLAHPAFAAFTEPRLRNWAGTEVGTITAEPGWLGGGTD
jgi:L-asparaginase II